MIRGGESHPRVTRIVMIKVYRTTFVLLVIWLFAVFLGTPIAPKEERFAGWLVDHPDAWAIVPTEAEAELIERRTPDQAKGLLEAYLRWNRGRTQMNEKQAGSMLVVALVFTGMGWMREAHLARKRRKEAGELPRE